MNGSDPGAFGHVGSAYLGYTTAALCFQEPAAVVVVLANSDEHDTDATVGDLMEAAIS